MYVIQIQIVDSKHSLFPDSGFLQRQNREQGAFYNFLAEPIIQKSSKLHPRYVYAGRTNLWSDEGILTNVNMGPPVL